jgi:hypothetical protein
LSFFSYLIWGKMFAPSWGFVWLYVRKVFFSAKGFLSSGFST